MKREHYISDSQVVKRAQAAVRLELEKNKEMDVPTIVFDRKTQTIYKQNTDGTRTPVSGKIRKGRYSERIAKKP